VGLAIGVDVGGTKVAAGVVTEDGEIAAHDRRPTPGGSGALTNLIADMIRSLVAGVPGHPVTAVGVAAAGYVSTDRSTVVSAPNLAWTNEPLGTWLARETGLPVVVENDANAAAWGEHRFGAGRGSDMVCVTVGTGIGGGLIVGGALQRGRYGFAAEVGHIPLVPDGRPCGCGSRGCWEQYGSGTALVQAARDGASADPAGAATLLGLAGGVVEGITGDDVTAAAQKGDPVALAAFEEVAGWSGRGLAVLAAVLDPPVVVVGGGVSEAGELLLEPMRRVFRSLHPTGMGEAIAEVRAAELGNDAGLVGAADLARR
jgi:glucokinase